MVPKIWFLSWSESEIDIRVKPDVRGVRGKNTMGQKWVTTHVSCVSLIDIRLIAYLY